MPRQYPLSLASGVLPGASPVECVLAAKAAGFDAVGLWIEPESLSAADLKAAQSALADSNLDVLDVEVIWLREGPLPAHYLRTLDIAVELNARNVLVVSSDPDAQATCEKFARLCAHVASTPLRVALEFAAFTEVVDLASATTILQQVNHPNQALLVDALHLTRSGGRAEQLGCVPASWLSYAQLCDSTLVGPLASEKAAIRDEAVNYRLCPGDGQLPLNELMRFLPPALPLSLEIRSRSLYAAYPDRVERARAVMRRAEHWLRGLKR